VFPFASCHPNTGKRLSQDILLLPTKTHESTNEDTQLDDRMPLDIIPIAINHGQETHPPDGTSEDEHVKT
jgi:hypothetical protein